MRSPSATTPCSKCGVPANTPAVAHRAHCPYYRKWAGMAPRVDRRATLTGRERVTAEGLADRLRDW